jgi:hemin uptake protein HemP
MTQENRMNVQQEAGQPGTDSAHSSTGSGQDAAALPCVALSSQDVLRGRKAVSISHNGTLYRLQTTRQGKLILTK